jgi:ABC-type transport system involved in multi-copper enzyme maturation permease subunit
MPWFTPSNHRGLGRSNWLRSFSLQSWAEALAAVALLAAAAVCWRFSGTWPTPYQVSVAAGLILAAAVAFRRGWLKLFGPVLFYDLVRTGRRRRHVVHRTLYALLLLYLLLFLFLTILEKAQLPGGSWTEVLAGRPINLRTLTDLAGAFWRELFVPQRLSARLLADFAALFFYIFACVQLLLVVLLTPAYTAGAVAAEKECGALQALLGTDLRNREIVLSLLVSRLANLILLLATALPILSLLEFLGGVEPNVMLASFVVTGLTLLSMGSLGIMQSVRSPRPLTAIMATYLWVLLYLGMCALGEFLCLPALDLAQFPSTDNWTSPVTLQDGVDWLNAGNPFWVAFELAKGYVTGLSLDALLPDLLRGYAWFHGLAAAGCVSWAVLRLRVCTLAAAESATRGKGDARQPGRVRNYVRRLWAWPLLWKEIVVGIGTARPARAWLGIGIVVAICFMPPIHILFWLGRFPANDAGWAGLGRMTNVWVRGASGLLGTLMLLQVALRAAGSVSGERARQTLDGLLITPLEPRTILFAKWLASILCPRAMAMMLGIVWVVALITRGVEPLAVPCFVVGWFVLAAFMASMGLYFSVMHRTTQRATLWTLVAVAFVIAVAVLAANDFSNRDDDLLAAVPPLMLGLLPFFAGDFVPDATLGRHLATIIAEAVAWWAVLAAALGLVAAKRFQVAIGRNRRRRRMAQTSAELQTVAVGAALAPAPAVQLNPNAAPAPVPTAKAAPKKIEEDVIHRPTWSQWLARVRAAVLLLLPLGVMMGLYEYHAIVSQERLRRAIAEADRLDPGWRLEQLEAARQVVPDERNSGSVILAAHDLMPRDQWPSDEFHKSLPDPLFPPDRLSAIQLNALGGELQRVAAALAQARKLADLPRGRFPLKWSTNGLWLMLEGTQDCRTSASLLQWDAEWRAHLNDPDGALKSCGAALNAGRAIGDEPTLISMLVRMAIRAITVAQTERTLALGEPSISALKALQEALEAEEAEPLLLIGMRGERACTNHMIESIGNGKADLTGGPDSFGLGGFRSPQGELLMVLAGGSLTSQWAEFLSKENAMVEIAKLPEHLQDARMTALTTTLTNAPPLVRMLTPAMQKVAFSQRRTGGELRCAIVMLAAERYRRDHQRWPDTLDELVPGYLRRVPADPFDGKPLRYRRLSAGVVIYSVGNDGVDNGGIIERRNHFKTGTDVGMRLWDVRRRGRPAPDPDFVGPPPAMD